MGNNEKNMKKLAIAGIIAIGSLVAWSDAIVATMSKADLDFLIDPVWSKLYGGSDYDQLCSIAPTSDGGFVGAGYTEDGTSINGNSYRNNDGLIVKYDKYGEPEFNSLYGGSGINTFYSINQTTDGGYITCGYTESDKSGTISTNKFGEDDALIVKFSPSGAIEWERRFGTTGARGENILHAEI